MIGEEIAHAKSAKDGKGRLGIKGLRGLRMTAEGSRREVALRRSEPRRLGRSCGGLKD